jgi:drug/metabolite transporter (DMT)-like permease
MIVAAGVLYQVCARQTEPSINPFAALIATYGTALLTAILLFFGTERLIGGSGLIGELKKANFASVRLGCVVVVYDLGFLLAYRAKHKASELSAHTTIIIMTAMFAIGVLLYKETTSLKQIIGFSIAAAGIFFTVF